MRKCLVFFALVLLLFPMKVFCQDYFRIEADFTVKIKKSDGNMNLTKGKVFYDKNIKELIYDINFPKIEKWAVKDTNLYKISHDTLTERVSIPSINEFTVFHLSLNTNLNDFGLKNSVYKISKVEKKGDLVLSYWKIPDRAKLPIDYVIVAKKNNKLESVVLMGKESKIISRQFFRNYVQIGAFEFPGQIIQILYDKNGKENYQVTEFKNISVNNIQDNDRYRCKFLKI